VGSCTSGDDVELLPPSSELLSPARVSPSQGSLPGKGRENRCGDADMNGSPPQLSKKGDVVTFMGIIAAGSSGFTEPILLLDFLSENCSQ